MPQDNPYAHFYDHDSFQSTGYPQRTSVMAIVSLVSGILSLPTMCLCFISIPFSLIAIVTGHSARAIVANSGGAYRGAGEALAGLIFGYCSLAIIAGCLVFFSLTSNIQPPGPVAGGGRQAAIRSEVLLEQAESRLYPGSDVNVSGVSTCEHNATDLAVHFIETLRIVDKTHFAETNSSVEPEPRAYRAFVQLNSDSCAFLLFVPEYARFTVAAKETLSESCWLIAQRSVDDILPQGSELAVAIYSDQGCQQRMIGTTTRKGPANAGLEISDAESTQLAEFFKLSERPVSEPVAEAAEFDSQIDNKDLPGELDFPAEAD